MILIRRTIVLLVLGSVILLADDIQVELQKQIDQIVLVDESNSSIDSSRVIVGCDDKADPVEKQNCYKESATAILTKLSTSSEKAPKADDIKAIKAQLSAILMQLAKLEKQQSEIIKNREKSLAKSNKAKSIVKSNSESNSTKSAKLKIKDEPKKIKILEETKEYTKIEVQKGENLSFYAKEFYNDSRKYRIIYNANQDKISKSLQIVEGIILKIPTTSFLKEHKEVEVIEKVEPKQKEEIIIEKTEPVKEEPKENKEVVVIEKVEVEEKIEKRDSNSSKVEMLDEVVIEEDVVAPIKKEQSNKKKESIPWIETRVKGGDDIRKIAEKYYGDSKEYYHILNLNKDRVGEDLKVKSDTSIKIPMTELFQEKPEFLNIR